MLGIHNRLIMFRSFVLVAASAIVLSLCTASAFAEGTVGWEVTGRSIPTVLPPGGEGRLELLVYNLGTGFATEGTVTDELPEGLTATQARMYIGKKNATAYTCTSGRSVVCSLPLAELGAPEEGLGTEHILIIEVFVKVSSEATGDTADEIVVSGGGAREPAHGTIPVSFGAKPANAGITNLVAWPTNADGTIDTQAGSHPYDLTVAFTLNNVGYETAAGAEARTINVNLPPGIVGNAQAVPQCPRTDLDHSGATEYYTGACPIASQIGRNQATVVGFPYIADSPVYNMVPPPGVAAEFAFIQNAHWVFIDSGVRTGGDNGITAHTRDLPEVELVLNTTTIWGVPAESSHDVDREGVLAEGQSCYTAPSGAYACPAGVPAVPFLTLPTSCGAPLEFTAEELGTWANENYVAPVARYVMQNDEGIPTGLTGCERLQPFKPEINIAPDTSYADTPAGLSVDVKMPQGLNTESLQTPNLDDTTVVLPEGVGINPGQATGLIACQSSEEAFGTEPNGETMEGPVSCPAASKVGTVEISTPLLRDKLQGNVYILGQNPPNLQLLIAASGDGVNLKVVGNVYLDENTGQLTSSFTKTPDFPFTDFKLNFSGGAQAALTTPTKCGTYETTADFTPWATPFIEDQFDTSLFAINAGPNGTPCVWPMPFSPSMIAGSTTDQAGGYTDFSMLLQRGDEQQRIKSLSFKTPEGLLGMISRVAPCGEPQASQGACSSASQIGHTVVGAGPGPYPFYIPQASAPPAPIYLTGPYKGAPFGLSIVVPLIAGPFNLGTEVVRAKLEVDPLTSQVTIATDPLPQFEKGIPADLRLINAVIDKPGFMFNPTDCAPMSFSGTATSVEGATAPLSSHFQMGSCQALKFQPDFKVSTNGKTSRKSGASLTAKIVYPVGNLGYNQASSQSNIQTVKVDLPKQLPSRLPTLQKACTAKQFDVDPAGCPSASIVGHAKAITPVLPVPLEGPAYFVSHGGEAFPNLIVVLQGDNVTVHLIGDTFINEKTNITSSTFKQIPDVPIQSFELNLPQGQYSALAANTNLCTVKGGLKMPTIFTAQNGATIKQTTPITTTGCTKHKTKKTKQKSKQKNKQSAGGNDKRRSSTGARRGAGRRSR